MAILFDCPFCSYGKNVPDSYYCKKIKCPRCLATLTLGVPQPTALTALPLPDEDDSPINQTAIEVEKSDSMLECPFCYELVNTQEKRCPYCRNYLDDDSLSDKSNTGYDETQRDGKGMRRYIASMDHAKQAFYLGIASLVCGLGIIFGPCAILYGLKTKASYPDELGEPGFRLVRAAITMGTVGIAGSLSFVIGFLIYLA